MQYDRRSFLTTTGLASGLAFVGASRFRRRREPGANEKVALAQIGTGGRGMALMSWAMEHPHVQFVALCDVNRQRAGRAAEFVAGKQGRRPKLIHDFRHLLEDASVDAAIVATPHHWHCPIGVRLIESGKHIYIEKPASHVFREGRLLLDAARRHNRIVQHGTQMRSSAVTAKAAELLASGLLGEIKMTKAWGVELRRRFPDPVPDTVPPDWLDWDLWLGPAPERPFNMNRFRHWNNYRDYGNGEIGGDGPHDIDIARWALGVNTHPIRITAHGSRIHVKGETEFPDNMMVAYQFPNDKVLIYENRNFAPYNMHGWDNGNIFYGTEGYLVFSRRGYFQTYLGAKEEKGPGMRGGAGNREHVHNFIDALVGKCKTSTTAFDAHFTCALVHLGEVAFRLERVLHFDPDKEQAIGDDEANAMLTKKYRPPWRLA